MASCNVIPSHDRAATALLDYIVPIAARRVGGRGYQAGPQPHEPRQTPQPAFAALIVRPTRGKTGEHEGSQGGGTFASGAGVTNGALASLAGALVLVFGAGCGIRKVTARMNPDGSPPDGGGGRGNEPVGGSAGQDAPGTGGTPGGGDSLQGSGGFAASGGTSGSGGLPTGGGGAGGVLAGGGTSGAGGAGGHGGSQGNGCVPTCTIPSMQCFETAGAYRCEMDESGCLGWKRCQVLVDASCFCDGPETPLCTLHARACIGDMPNLCVLGSYGSPTWVSFAKCDGPDAPCTTESPTCCSNDPECPREGTYCRTGERFFGLCRPGAYGCFEAGPAVFPTPGSIPCR
jgi:hypothetical protein